MLKIAIKLQGLDQKYYNTHSLCIGIAVDLLKLQVPVPKIMKLGLWQSNIMYSYLKNIWGTTFQKKKKKIFLRRPYTTIE